MRFLWLLFSLPCFAIYDANTPLAEVRWELGESKPLHALENIDPVLAQKGKEIFFQGQTRRPNGELTQPQAPAFRCNHCHNSVKEDPKLSVNDPEARLDYALANGIAFLPGTTMYGSVNRTSWFNGDYLKKYGEDLIGPARKNFKNAVQLCSKECSKGRALDEWELEAMLNYLWSIQYRLGDFNLTAEEYDFLNFSRVNNQEKLLFLDSKYLKFSDATFSKAPEDFETGYGTNGDPQKGEAVFKSSCVHCHKVDSGIQEKIVHFEDNRKTYKYLYRMKHSYSVAREGHFESETVYMPNYTQERLSDKQLDDLKAFLKEKLQ